MWNFQSSLNVSMNDLKIIQVTQRLHQVFKALHNSELKDSLDPYQPEVFLQSLRYSTKYKLFYKIVINFNILLIEMSILYLRAINNMMLMNSLYACWIILERDVN